MKFDWRSMFIVAGLGMSVGFVAPGCVVRAQVRPAYVVDQAPPAPQYETPAPRVGFLWVQGRWEWRANQWQWTRGHWVRARAGQNWEAGRWEQRGNRWHWIEGRWTASAGGDVHVRDHRTPTPAPTPVGPNVRDHRTPAPAPVAAYPTMAPPAPQYETPAARSGFVWVQGNYEWKAGAYAWTRGHWERAQAAKVWVPGVWAAEGGRWVWTPGHWADAPAAAPGPNVRDHRTPAPTERKNEVVPARRGGQR